MSELDDALKAFLIESREGLDQLEEDLVELERNPAAADRLDRIFRTIHTIKGTCGFFGFNRLEQLTHAAEDVLARLRDGELTFSSGHTGALLELVDTTRHMLLHIEHHAQESDIDGAALIMQFQRLLSEEEEGVQLSPSTSPASPPTVEIERQNSGHDKAIRVDVELLDKLMNVAGELVLTRNQILQHVTVQGDSTLTSITQRLNLITTELQEGVMRTRMQPISTLWGAFPRLVRDLEQQTGKRVRLVREGGDTELDRSLLQAIKDPLVHILRNAVDHGLEAPAQRLACGKVEVGLLRFNATHESGYVIIEISDDGAGINTAAVLDKAVARDLVRADQTAGLSEHDILEFLFQPGFSTAAEVTSVSGRGVGLDVVRNNLDRIGGTVDIQTWPGRGTRFRLKIPLTLAIIPAVVISCHDERYAVPQSSILEIVRLEPEQIEKKIQRVHESQVYQLRDKFLPLADLRHLLQLPTREGGLPVFILVLVTDGQEFGLIVDAIRDTEEIVVKSLGRHIKGASYYAGATIMGDGRVALILDALALARGAHVFNQEHTVARHAAAHGLEAPLRGDRHSLLVIKLGPNGRGAIPLAWVQRLEKLPSALVEKSARGEMVQYRGEILPLLRLDRLLGHAAEADGEELQVIVHRSAGGLLGLVVDDVIDIVDEDVTGAAGAGQTTLTDGLAVVQGRVTEVLDMDAIMAMARRELQLQSRRVVMEAS